MPCIILHRVIPDIVLTAWSQEVFVSIPLFLWALLPQIRIIMQCVGGGGGGGALDVPRQVSFTV